jgi:hypothetical protein
VKDEKQLVFQLEHQPFAQPAQTSDGLTFRRCQWRIHAPKEKWAEQAYFFKYLPRNAGVQTFQIDNDVR